MSAHPKIHNRILAVLLALSVIGFADAAYLSAEHFLKRIPPCSITGGCEQVLTSSYAAMFGIPTALFGAMFYLCIFILMFLYREGGARKFLLAAFALSATAFLASLWLVYLQVAVIGALCFYCLISATTSTLIFGGVAWLLKIASPREERSPA
jgi:uncharacterized membrane protein